MGPCPELPIFVTSALMLLQRTLRRYLLCINNTSIRNLDRGGEGLGRMSEGPDAVSTGPDGVSKGLDGVSEGLEGCVKLLLSVSPHSRLLVSFPVAFVFLVCGNSGDPG